MFRLEVGLPARAQLSGYQAGGIEVVDAGMKRMLPFPRSWVVCQRWCCHQSACWLIKGQV
jgi:hypothetical protein